MIECIGILLIMSASLIRFQKPILNGMNQLRSILSFRPNNPKLGARLERAGISKSEASRFVLIQGSLAAGGLLIGLVLFYFGSPPLLIPCLPAIGYLFPRLALKKRIFKRQREIVLSLPYYLDILTLAMEAGLDLIAAFEELLAKDSPNALKEELLITLKSIRMGEARSRAFFALADRTGVEPLSLLAGCIAQSEELGASLGGLLRLQSESLRRDIHKDAEERAQRAPMKMLLPLVVFIFPVLFVLLFAPIALKMLATS